LIGPWSTQHISFDKTFLFIISENGLAQSVCLPVELDMRICKID